MGYLSQSIRGVGGRRIIMALGGLYLGAAATAPVTLTGAGRSDTAVLVVALLAGGCGLGLAYSGYRLPGTNIRPDLYHVVAGWIVRAIGVMVSIIILISLITNFKDFFANLIILTALTSLAGLGMGYHDGKAKTRAVDAEEYAQQLERYQTIVETVNDGIIVVDDESRFMLVNDAYAELVGYGREELIGSHVSLVTGEETGIETMAEMVTRDLEDGDADARTYEATLETASEEILEVESTVAPMPDQDDGGHDWVVVVRDMTERNERERQLAERNEQLNNFASMLAHELRNPVNIGQIYSQQLSREDNTEAVEYVTQAFDRIESIIDSMLLITRGREATSERVSINLADVAHDVWGEMDVPDATLDVQIDLKIEADETYVRQLFRNLFQNAIEHGGSDVTVTVGELPTGFYVADDGVGIPADDREAVFETGYTSASDQDGMGLGLTFVQEMADVYDWEYRVTESDAGGAQFEFENVSAIQHA